MIYESPYRQSTFHTHIATVKLWLISYRLMASTIQHNTGV